MNISWVHIRPQQMPHGVYDQKALTTFDELTPVKASLLGGRRAVFHTLRVDDSDCGQRFFVCFNTMKHVTARAAPLVGNQQPCIIFRPFSEVPVNGLPSGETLGQISPNNAVFSQIEDGRFGGPIQRFAEGAKRFFV